MIRVSYLLCFISCGLAHVANGQFAEPSPEDKALLNQQASELFVALKPAVAKAARGTVEVQVWRKRVGFGTVVAPGKVLTKWSEVKRDVRSLSCRGMGGEWGSAKVVGIYRDADLAVLEVDGLRAEPVQLDQGDRDLKLGEFLALARPDGEAAAMGVVSVLPRSLRSTDRAFLGVIMDLKFSGPGVRVTNVEPDTGAFDSGLRKGDVILKVVDKEVNGSFELKSVLQKLEPGQEIKISYQRGKERKVAAVTLGGRPNMARIPYTRMEQMNNMGGHRYSDVKDGFRDVIQSDMQLKPSDCGAPVIDLEGRTVGIAVARAGRIKTYIIPSAAIGALLSTPPSLPRLEELAGRARPAEGDGGREEEDPFAVMRRKMEEMRRLMDEIEQMDQ
jgi:serine protease Do